MSVHLAIGFVLTVVFGLTPSAGEPRETVDCAEGGSVVVRCSGDALDCFVGCRWNASIRSLCLPRRLQGTRHLRLDLQDCRADDLNHIPMGLFPAGNRLRTLSISYAPWTAGGISRPEVQGGIRSIAAGTFANLDGVEELTLEGFDLIRSVDSAAFAPLRSIKRLRLIRFGAQFLSYAALGAALRGLSNTSLDHVTMDGIHAISNREKVLALGHLFDITGANVTSLVFVNNDFNAVTGALSAVLPALRYLECSVYWLTFAATSFGLDSLIFLRNIEEVNFSFIGKRSISEEDHNGNYGPPDSTCYLCVLTQELLDYYIHLNTSADCYFFKTIKFVYSLKRITIRNMDFFKPDGNPDLCLDEGNQLEYVDLSGSPIGTIDGRMRGFKRLRYLNLQGTGLRRLSVRIFDEMPRLEALLLGRNNRIGESVLSRDRGSGFFGAQNETLTSLDLSDCGLVDLPVTLFSGLVNLERLNLSRNRLERFDANIDNCTRLTVLNLSENSLQTLSRKTLTSLESIGAGKRGVGGGIGGGGVGEGGVRGAGGAGGRLVLDLSGNPLTCFCNNTWFVSWLQTTAAVSLRNFDAYRCLHPNGSHVTIARLNATALAEEDCRIHDELTNVTRCPCSGLDFNRLRQAALSLADVNCSIGDNRFTYLELVSNSNRTLGPYWWCESVVVREESRWHTSPKFIVPVALGCAVLLALCSALIIVYRKRRYKPFESMIECMDLRPYVTFIMRALAGGHHHEGHEGEGEGQRRYDVLVYFDDDDATWTRQVIVSRMEHLSVISTYDFEIGAAMLDNILDAIAKSSALVFVLSASFAANRWCREALLRAYASRPAAVIPVVRGGGGGGQGDVPVGAFVEGDVLLSNVFATNNPLYLPPDAEGVEADGESVLKELMRRIENARSSEQKTK